MAPKRKRTVEIYFVLYLAALVFLLPDKRDIDRFFFNNVGTPIFQPLFTLLPEKTTLTCRAILDSTGPKIIATDSVNTIFYSGDVEDVTFEFEIEDQTLRQSMKLTSNDRPTSKFFRYEEHKDQQAASFIWSPPLHERVSKTYLVKVIATARSKGNSPIFLGQKNPTGTPQTIRVKTQFSLLLIFLNSSSGLPVFPQQIAQQNRLDSLNMFGFPFMNRFDQPSTGKMSFNGETKISPLAYQNWTNLIYGFNINFLKDKADYNISVVNYPPDNGGSATLQDKKENYLLMTGKTPSNGRTVVTLNVHRKHDDAEAAFTFEIMPQRYQQPEFAKNMYPEKTYIIDPKLPVYGKNQQALLKDGSTVRAGSYQGEKFSFTPEVRDTGRTFYLERYVDGSLLGQKMPVRIMNLPDPEILDIRRIGENEIDVQTRASGLVDGENNEVVRFETDGNVKFEDKRGRIVIDRGKEFCIQHFRLVPANPSKSFRFKFRAVDKRGRVSALRSFQGD